MCITPVTNLRLNHRYITREDLAVWAKRHPELEVLDISDSAISVFDVREVLPSCKNLIEITWKELNVSSQNTLYHQDIVRALAVLPNGMVVSSSFDNMYEDETHKVWDVELGKRLKTFEGHKDMVRALAVLPNGTVVSGSSDLTLRVWPFTYQKPNLGRFRTFSFHCSVECSAHTILVQCKPNKDLESVEETGLTH